MDISKLFKWKKEYTIVGVNGEPLLNSEGEEIRVYLRVIGDNDLDRARKYALQQTRKLRASYQKDSAQILPDFDEFSVEALATLIVLNEASTIYKEAERETTIKFPTNKDTFDIEDAENYVKERDEYFENLVVKVDEEAQKLLNQRMEYYKNLSHEDLKSRAEKSYINKIIEGDLSKLSNDAILYFSVYEDEECTKKIFESIDDVRSAAPMLKEQLYTEYSKLVLTDLDLKK
jgi:hypothetical protein